MFSSGKEKVQLEEDESQGVKYHVTFSSISLDSKQSRNKQVRKGHIVGKVCNF